MPSSMLCPHDSDDEVSVDNAHNVPSHRRDPVHLDVDGAGDAERPPRGHRSHRTLLRARSLLHMHISFEHSDYSPPTSTGRCGPSWCASTPFPLKLLADIRSRSDYS
jgi:hypothetical protein